jgi:hypothetical protein
MTDRERGEQWLAQELRQTYISREHWREAEEWEELARIACDFAERLAALALNETRPRPYNKPLPWAEAMAEEKP